MTHPPHPPPKDLCGGVEAFKSHMGHKHIVFLALGVGLVTLLHDRKCVPHMVVKKMDPKVGLDFRPPPEPLHRS